MSHKKKEEKPLEKNISNIEAIRRLYNLTAIIMCNTCDKRDTCVNRTSCGTYSDKPPNCPTCGEVMDKKGDKFFCTACVLKEMKKKKLEGLT